MDVALLLSKPRGKVVLGPLLEIEQRKNCSFCDFVKRAIHQQHDDFLPAEFWADCKVREQQVDCYLDDFVLESPEPTRDHRCGIFIKTDPELRFSQLYRQNFLAFDHPTFQLLANDGRSQDAYLKAREIFPQIDWILPLRWLQLCEKIHPYTPRKINEIRLIDLDNECLVSNSQCGRYFALSYVWGRNQRVTLNEVNLRELHEYGNLAATTEGLSKTIRDAMLLTRAMKERYLCVDALCIIQGDKEDEKAQIQRMDEIYQNAVLTIVACHGSDAECGLPGVAPQSRYPKQVMAEVEGQKLVGYTPDRWRSKRDSKWSTRCWTFQEEFLSNRLTIVTTNQLFFECKADCEFCEEVVQEIETFTPADSDFFPAAYTPRNRTASMHTQTKFGLSPLARYQNLMTT